MYTGGVRLCPQQDEGGHGSVPRGAGETVAGERSGEDREAPSESCLQAGKVRLSGLSENAPANVLPWSWGI